MRKLMDHFFFGALLTGLLGLGYCSATSYDQRKPIPGSPEHQADLRRKVGACVDTIPLSDWTALKESEINRRLAICAEMTVEYDRLYR